MKLKVLLPTEVLVDEEVQKIGAEAEDGELTLLPHHIGLTTTLVPGVLSFELSGGREEFVATAEGVMVKCGEQVLISTRNGIRGTELGRLRERVEEEFTKLDERAETARMSLNKIEATFFHRFIESEHGYE